MKLKNKHLAIAFITGVVMLIVQVVLFNWKKHPGWWSSNEDGINYFLPAWTLIYMFIGYHASLKYQKEKNKFLPNGVSVADKDYNKRLENWKRYKVYVFSNFARLYGIISIFIVFGLLLSYFDGSRYLVANIPAVSIFAIMGIGSFLSSKLLKKKYNI